MDEYIKRKAALEECDWYANEFCECEYAIMPLKGALENLHAADVRPVVLCRDCKHEGLLSCPMVVIEKQQMVFINHDPEFFCASGERKK